MHKTIGILLGYIVFLAGCTTPPQHEMTMPSSGSYPDNYETFDEYVSQTRTYLQNNRYFLTGDHDAEIKANMPFELAPINALSANASSEKKGILLIHGLGDSPWSFIDIAQSLAEQGFLVRTLLLPGHGTRPGDMLSVDADSWMALVEQQTELLKQQVDSVYLGGFSTGGNLAYLQSVKDPDVKGLLLISPGFESNEPLLPLASLVAPIKPWLMGNEPDNSTNYMRYSMVPTNGFSQFHTTSKAVKKSIKKADFTRPVLMVLTEHDSVLDTKKISDFYLHNFTNPNNRLLWFGDAKIEKESVINIASENRQYKVSNMSHMGSLFKTDNPYYGVNGSQRICHNGQFSNDNATDWCESGEEVWFSAFGYEHPERIHARTTFNPNYDLMLEQVSHVF